MVTESTKSLNFANNLPMETGVLLLLTKHDMLKPCVWLRTSVLSQSTRFYGSAIRRWSFASVIVIAHPFKAKPISSHYVTARNVPFQGTVFVLGRGISCAKIPQTNRSAKQCHEKKEPDATIKAKQVHQCRRTETCSERAFRYSEGNWVKHLANEPGPSSPPARLITRAYAA